MKLITTATFRPGRACRYLVARCLVLTFEVGETKSLYNVVTTLHGVVSAAGKFANVGEKESKL
jgi:hypothetical protein